MYCISPEPATLELHIVCKRRRFGVGPCPGVPRVIWRFRGGCQRRGTRQRAGHLNASFRASTIRWMMSGLLCRCASWWLESGDAHEPLRYHRHQVPAEHSAIEAHRGGLPPLNLSATSSDMVSSLANSLVTAGTILTPLAIEKVDGAVDTRARAVGAAFTDW